LNIGEPPFSMALVYTIIHIIGYLVVTSSCQWPPWGLEVGKYRFDIGNLVMCNLGERGWKLGRVIALDYRESNWEDGDVAPYQVALEEDRTLIYVPIDDARFCRQATEEDLNILIRKDALARNDSKIDKSGEVDLTNNQLICNESIDFSNYRNGRCDCCNDCPKAWTYAELYSEHYRCATRNGLKITRFEDNLGTISVGDNINHERNESIPCESGFLQAPTLVRLPPGIIFSDDGSIQGEVLYDPHREENYDVRFVAVSTLMWDSAAVGIVRYEISFSVQNNRPPAEFDKQAFESDQAKSRKVARKLVDSLNSDWLKWENGTLDNLSTCQTMGNTLRELRVLLEDNPRLDNGKWWGHLGGYHMNVHKLLDNALFECELYLGYALTFGDDDVKYYAEQNLKGCYNKRLLEAARFMWMDGIEYMLQEQWTQAIELFRLAAKKKEGWGWAVNYGDIWLSEAVATIIQNCEIDGGGLTKEVLERVNQLILQCVKRTNDSRVFGSYGHPWASEIEVALKSYGELTQESKDTENWLKELKARTVYWCSQVLAGMSPFPPQERPRRESAEALIDRLPKHN
tara:strand:+ start:6712 stop:8430 length:1719 start_codon:yes stop_codon:yes gene_type:complete